MDEKRDVIFTKSFDCIIDMDVKHGIKRVEIDCNVYMQHTKKSFPDVEELMIGPDVDEICIPNTLFPNVQMVYSDSIFFLAGRYLVKKRNGRPTLLNAFCKDEALEISVIVSIADYALANSNIKKIPYNYSALIRCEPMAFKDSYFEKQPFVNGVKTAGRIIVAIDPEADEVILPDEEYSMAVCAVGVNLADVKHLVIELHEGLLRLGRKALFGTNIESVHLPASIKKLEYNCFGSNLKELAMETFPSDFGTACIMGPSPFDAGNKIIKVYCNGKHLYFPRIIQPSMSSYAIDEMKYFFKNPRIKTVSMCKYAFSISCQGKVALLECLDFGSESAREHIKKYSYSILSNMIQEGSEKFAAKIVETGLVSNDILQKMIPKAENAEMFTLKAYMLNQLNLNGVQEEKISYAI